MKLVLLVVAFLFQTPRGSVTGTVVVSGTSTPIAEADVAILTREGLFETTTDSNGRFSLTNVPAGQQTVLIRADGFFAEPPAANMAYPPKAEVPVTVAAGAAPAAMPTVSLVRSGTISGRVVDPQGAPLPFARVQALRSVAGTANPDQLRDLASRMTDDRGEYRMFWVPPGEYVIQAMGGAQGPNPTPTPGGTIQRQVPTFFPSTAEATEATKVVVRSGEEVRGIDITTRSVFITLPPPSNGPTVPGFKVSGIVIDGLSPWVGTAGLLLGSPSSAEPPRAVGSVIIGGNPGRFEIPNVPPGSYELFASLGTPTGPGWGRTLFEVRDGEVADLQILIHPSVDVQGVVKIDGEIAARGGTLKIGLSPKGVAGRIGNYRGIIDRAQAPGADGKFAIPGAAEGEYDVFIQGAADNLYIADVRQGDTSIMGSGLAVRQSAPALIEVHLVSDGGVVEGMAPRGATVVLAGGNIYKTTTAGADGKYAFRGVRPGDYKLLASAGPLPPAGPTPEMLSKSVGVTAKPATTIKVDVP
jgi:hypothetical protein